MACWGAMREGEGEGEERQITECPPSPRRAMRRGTVIGDSDEDEPAGLELAVAEAASGDDESCRPRSLQGPLLLPPQLRSRLQVLLPLGRRLRLRRQNLSCLRSIHHGCGLGLERLCSQI